MVPFVEEHDRVVRVVADGHFLLVSYIYRVNRKRSRSCCWLHQNSVSKCSCV
jgi:hypothetical protein